MSIQRINAGPRMSSAVVHGNTVYLAGLTADDAKADVKGQTKQILDKIDALLKAAGTDKSKVLSAKNLETLSLTAPTGLGRWFTSVLLLMASIFPSNEIP